MKIIKEVLYTLIFFILLLPASVFAKKPAAVSYSFPGGIAELILDKQTDTLPDIKFGIEEPVIIEYDEHWRVLIGIPLPGEYLVYIKRAIKDLPALHQKIFVRQKNYALTQTQTTKLTTALQHKKLSELQFQNTQQPSLPLQKPVETNWNESFGQLSLDAKNKHLIQQNLVYLDQNQTIDIHAPQNAIISNIKTDRNGKSTVYLDHGRGLYSVITGLHETTVKIGKGVLSGAVIGKVSPVSNTSNNAIQRITWQCIMNGAFVNPIILTKL